MNAISLQAFAALHPRADEVVERQWPPGAVVDTHSHPFAVKALVVHGAMALTARGITRELRPGDRFELDADEPHAERYGPEGATYWVARHETGRR